MEAPRPQDGASRQGVTIHIVPLDPAYKAGLAGHVPVKGSSLPALPTGRQAAGRDSRVQVKNSFF